MWTPHSRRILAQTFSNSPSMVAWYKPMLASSRRIATACAGSIVTTASRPLCQSSCRRSSSGEADARCANCRCPQSGVILPAGAGPTKGQWHRQGVSPCSEFGAAVIQPMRCPLQLVAGLCHQRKKTAWPRPARARGPGSTFATTPPSIRTLSPTALPRRGGKTVRPLCWVGHGPKAVPF